MLLAYALFMPALFALRFAFTLLSVSVGILGFLMPVRVAKACAWVFYYPTLLVGYALLEVARFVYGKAYRCEYSEALTLRAEQVKKTLADGQHPPGTIVELENLHRAILTSADIAELPAIKRRTLTEFLLGVWYCARDLVFGAALEIDLSDENVRVLMNHTCFNNLFDHAKRRKGKYEVDLSVFHRYEVETGYVCYGAKGFFNFNSSSKEALLREIEIKNVKGEIATVRPGDANWDTAKMHFIICCDNEVLFNHHAHVHISTMRLKAVQEHLDPSDPIYIALQAVSHHVTVLNEHIYTILYKYTSPLYPTALHIDAIQDIHLRGQHNEYFDELSSGLLYDCEYQQFNSDGFSMVKKAVAEAFAALSSRYVADGKVSECREKFVVAARDIINPRESKELDLKLVTVIDALKAIVTKLLTDVLIVSDCEHHQVRKLGFYKSLLRCKKRLDGTPVTFSNSQYLMDVFSRILFRTVFSGDHPVEAAMDHALVNGDGLPGLNLRIEASELKAFGAKYPKYIDVEKIAMSIDY